MLTQVTVNLTGKTQRRSYKGRDTIIAPLTMIVPGVLNGSKGPLFYPEEELRRNPAAWNAIPIVIGHPFVGGQPVSARQPDILDASQIGEVHEAKYNGKLTALAYFDVEHTRRIDERVLNALERGQPLELSTGLLTDDEPTGGVFNGREYQAIARNYRPDHLAVLPGEKGACSLKDGCGVMINSEGEEIIMHTAAVTLVMNEDGDTEELSELIADPEVTGNKSLDDIRIEIETQLQGERFGNPGEAPFLVEVFMNGFIYSKNGKLWRLPYKIKGEVLTILDARPEQVQMFKRYVPVNPEQPNLSQVVEEMRMNKEQMIDDLIANCDCWDESDRTTLNAMKDPQLKKTYDHSIKVRRDQAVANAARKGFEQGDVGFTFNEETTSFEVVKKTPTPAPAANAERPAEKPKDFKTWMSEAPPEVRQVVQNAVNWEHSQKQECITKITSNKKNVFNAEQLGAMSLDQLKAIAALAEPEPEMEVFGMPSYVGAAVANQTANKHEEEPLPLPVMSFGKED